METQRELAIKVAWRMWGGPYLWGGDDPMEGFDCSGLCVEILKSVGILPRNGDWNAHGLYRLFEDNVVDSPVKGCLVICFINNLFLS